MKLEVCCFDSTIIAPNLILIQRIYFLGVATGHRENLGIGGEIDRHRCIPGLYRVPDKSFRMPERNLKEQKSIKPESGNFFRTGSGERKRQWLFLY